MQTLKILGLNMDIHTVHLYFVLYFADVGISIFTKLYNQISYFSNLYCICLRFIEGAKLEKK